MTFLPRSALAAVAALFPAAFPAAGLANPAGGTVVAGDVTIGGQGSQMVITQNSNSAIVNWNSFSVGANDSVQFNQASASAAILNRVTGGSASNILGSISSNGRVFLVNAKGIVFGRGASINVGSLIATTLDINDADFSAGRYSFRQGSKAPAGISNAGDITANGGNVVLLADHVDNSGFIEASFGTVALHAGAGLTLSFDGDGLVSYEVDGAAAASSNQAGVSNSGALYADGGTVLMTAAVARSLIKTVVNNSGMISAYRAETGADGTIVLAAGGGDVELSGTITGGNVAVVASRDVVKTAAASLDMDVDGLSVSAGRDIRLASDATEGFNSNLNVGYGYAIGADADLISQLQQKFPDLVPYSLAPNAGFDAGGVVELGHLFVGGGYLYVRATQVSAQGIGTEGALFYNYRPTSDSADTDVVTSFSLPIAANSLTLAFGGGGYDGDINIGTAQALALSKAFSGSDANYVFMTNGKVNGVDSIQTSGIVAVLAGTGGGSQPPPYEDDGFGAELASVTSGLDASIGFHPFTVSPPDDPEISEAPLSVQCQ